MKGTDMSMLTAEPTPKPTGEAETTGKAPVLYIDTPASGLARELVRATPEQIAAALLANPEARMAVIKQIADAEALELAVQLGATLLRARLPHLEEAAELLRLPSVKAESGDVGQRLRMWVRRDQALSDPTAESARKVALCPSLRCSKKSGHDDECDELLGCDVPDAEAVEATAGEAQYPCLADMPFWRDGLPAGSDVCRLPRGHVGAHRSALLPRAEPAPVVEAPERVTYNEAILAWGRLGGPLTPLSTVAKYITQQWAAEREAGELRKELETANKANADLRDMLDDQRHQAEVEAASVKELQRLLTRDREKLSEAERKLAKAIDGYRQLAEYFQESANCMTMHEAPTRRAYEDARDMAKASFDEFSPPASPEPAGGEPAKPPVTIKLREPTQSRMPAGGVPLLDEQPEAKPPAPASQFKVGQRVRHQIGEGEVLGPNRRKVPPHTWVRLDDTTAHCLPDTELEPAETVQPQPSAPAEPAHHDLNEHTWCVRCDRFDPSGPCPGKPADPTPTSTEGPSPFVTRGELAELLDEYAKLAAQVNAAISEEHPLRAVSERASELSLLMLRGIDSRLSKLEKLGIGEAK